MDVFCSEVQDKALLMNNEYKIQGQVCVWVKYVHTDNELLVDCQLTFTCYICEAYKIQGQVCVWVKR